MNIMTICDAATAASVCVEQNATTRKQIEDFMSAYTQVKTTNTKVFNEITLEKFVHFLARIIEPEKNKDGYRKNSTNENGDGERIFGEKLQRVMENFYRGFINTNLSPEELYFEFLQIAPFQDGNGRISDLIWRMAKKRQTGSWPPCGRPKRQ